MKESGMWTSERHLHLAAVSYTDSLCFVQFRSDSKDYELTIELNRHIHIRFTDRLTDKADVNEILPCTRVSTAEGLELELQSSNRLMIYRDGRRIINLGPTIKLQTDDQNRAYQVTFDFAFEGRGFYGFGEKFDKVNQNGKTPFSDVTEQYTHQQDKTYFPIPFFFTDAGIGFCQKGSYPAEFDMTMHEDQGMQCLTLRSGCSSTKLLWEAILFEGTPGQILASYQNETGKATLPPEWSFGPWMSSNGWNTQAEALYQIEQMDQLSIPASVMVLEAWSDEETFYIWNDACYTPSEDGNPFCYQDFTFSPEGKWPDPKSFTDRLNHSNVKLILWQIPVVKYEAALHGRQLDLDEAYAIDHNLCIKNEDGTPYRNMGYWFSKSLLPDFSNPETKHWWFEKRRYLIEELGVAGFKTDGGEFLYGSDAILSDGRGSAEAHNDYPNLYIGAYHEFMDQVAGNGKCITFSRAGYTGGQKYPIHWAGDQLSEFSELKAQLTAGLSLGLSGVPFWGFDIGGFAGDFPSTELYIRATAMAVFSPIMQFHSEPRYGQYYMTERNHLNNDRSPWNLAEANKDSRIIPLYRLFANLRMNLLPYILREARFCSDTGRPLMAHLIYDYSETELDHVLDMETQYMFGRNLLVAPVIDEGAEGREIYLPAGEWYDLWTGDLYHGGRLHFQNCSLDRIPVYVREGTMLPVNINRQYIMGSSSTEGFVSNDCSRYENLCFLLYGKAECDFDDGKGNIVKIMEQDCIIEVSGFWKERIALAFINGSDRQVSSEVCNLQCNRRQMMIFGKSVTGVELIVEIQDGNLNQKQEPEAKRG